MSPARPGGGVVVGGDARRLYVVVDRPTSAATADEAVTPATSKAATMT
jgi:hypothetical protein